MTPNNTPTKFLRELNAILQTHSEKTGEDVNRLRRRVAFDRFLARIFSADMPSFFVKGGYAMELRIAQARATKDLDLTRIKTKNDTKEPPSALIHQELQHIARIDLNDYFGFSIGQPQNDIENAPYGGSSYSVNVTINSKTFINFHLDVGIDIQINETEKVVGPHWLEFCSIPASVIHIISIEQQFAEKLHSYTLPRTQTNTRAKDLIDLVLLLQHENRTEQGFKRALERVFACRQTHPLPELLPEPPISWQKPFTEMASECGLTLDLNSAFLAVSTFYNSFAPL